MIDGAIRVDKWLWHARLFNSRTKATRLCREGRIRVDGRVIRKADHRVAPGSVLTVPISREIQVVRVLAVGTRRGPPDEARSLYETIPPRSAPAAPAAPASKEAGP